MQYNESDIQSCTCAVYDVDNVRMLVEPSAPAETNLLYEFRIRTPDLFGGETLKCVVRGPDGECVESVVCPDVDESGYWLTLLPTPPPLSPIFTRIFK